MGKNRKANTTIFCLRALSRDALLVTVTPCHTTSHHAAPHTPCLSLAGGVQPVASMVTINTQLITSATRRLRLQLPGGATITAIRRADLDKLATLSLATPAGTSIPAGTAAAAAAGAPGMPIIWVGEVVGQRGGVSSVTLLVGENGGVYGNIR